MAGLRARERIFSRVRHPPNLIEQRLTGSVIGAFFEVYNALGYGLLESVYAAALAEELVARGHAVEREVFVDVFYKGKPISRQRLDLLVDKTLVLEIKATELLSRFSFRQMLSYLTATRLPLGLILHFGPRARFHRLVQTNRQRRAH
jgi:GxxExxY protein